MKLSLVVASVLTLVACGGSAPASIRGPDLGDATVFIRKPGTWAVSLPQPGFPYNAEPEPRMRALSGGATAAPFGCGLVSVRQDYFTGARGQLACVSRDADGALAVTPTGRGVFSAVHDALVTDRGPVILADPRGRSGLVVLTLGPDGRVRRAVDLRQVVEQAVVLSADRIATLSRRDGRCEWTVHDVSADTAPVISLHPVDDPLACDSASGGAEIIRDQATGAAYFRPRRSGGNALYRLQDNGDASPATRVADDFAAGAPGASDPGLVTIVNGAVWFERASDAGPVVGRYDLKDRALTLTDFRSATGRWQDVGQVYGLMLEPGVGAEPRVAMMDRGGRTRVLPLRSGPQTASAVTD